MFWFGASYCKTRLIIRKRCARVCRHELSTKKVSIFYVFRPLEFWHTFSKIEINLNYAIQLQNANLIGFCNNSQCGWCTSRYSWGKVAGVSIVWKVAGKQMEQQYQNNPRVPRGLRYTFLNLQMVSSWMKVPSYNAFRYGMITLYVGTLLMVIGYHNPYMAFSR